MSGQDGSIIRPRFSVIVPAYNAAATVSATLRSVLAQQAGDFELIVVDDGSTDGTADAIAPFLADHRVILISQSNRGLAGARNAGIEAARGTYVALLDSDDLWMPHYLAAMGGLLDSRPDAAFASCDAWLYEDRRGQIRRESALDYQEAPAELPSTAEELLSRLLRHGNFIYGGATIRRAALETVGPFRTGLRAAEDFELWVRFAANGLIGVRHPDRLAVYRLRAGSLSRQEELITESLLEVYRSVAEELAVPPQRAADARVQVRRLDDRLATLRRRRPRPSALRPRLGRMREGLFAARTWYPTPPPELSAALPELFV